jgi:hypothetical protein
MMVAWRPKHVGAKWQFIPQVNVFLIKCNILEFYVHLLVIIKLVYCTKCTVKILKKNVNAAFQSSVSRSKIRIKSIVYVICRTITVYLECSNHISRVYHHSSTRKFAESKYYPLRLSVRMEKLGSHWTDFPGISHFSIFRKSVEKIQISLTSDTNNGNCIWRHVCIYGSISLNSSYYEKRFTQNL